MTSPVAVQLFIAPGCPHCPSVMQVLSEFVKEGLIAELTINNLVLVPEKAQSLDVRSVPWIKIGPFELTGMHTRSELQIWIERVGSDEGMQAYLVELFTSGELLKVISLIKNEHDLIKHLPPLMASNETPLGAKIGIGAVFEEFQGNSIIRKLIPELSALLESDDPSVRNDACYYLGLTESVQAITAIEKMLRDEQEEIRETAHDALSIIEDAQPSDE